MSTKRHPVLLVIGIGLLLMIGIAVFKRDTIAGLILRGGDVSLAGEAARTSPQAKLAIDFLGALRSMDMGAITKLATAEQISRIQQEMEQPSAEFQEMRTMMLDDLGEDRTVLLSRVKTVQTHGDRSVVLFETKANSWFVQLTLVDGTWKVSGF